MTTLCVFPIENNFNFSFDKIYSFTTRSKYLSGIFRQFNAQTSKLKNKIERL